MAKYRICSQCGSANNPEVAFCGACANQLLSTGTAVVRSEPALPALSGRDKATLGGVAVGVAAMALRVGAALLRQAAERRDDPIVPRAAGSTAVEPLSSTPPGTLRVRRRWVVGDRFGPLRWGEEELEIDGVEAEQSGFRISLGRPRW